MSDRAITQRRVAKFDSLAALSRMRAVSEVGLSLSIRKDADEVVMCLASDELEGKCRHFKG